MRITLSIILSLVLAACAKDNANVRITADAPEKSLAKPVQMPRSEPVFYNGKTYQLDFAPQAGGSYTMRVRGMSAQQQRDAVAVATSSLRYFACPEGQNGILTNRPGYSNGIWSMGARCG